jgi:hypothetical protein
MKKLFLLLFLPLGLFAKSPSSIMSPTIYDLTGVLRADQQVVSMITDEAKLAEYSFNPENNYLTIPTYGVFYYAAVTDSVGDMSYLYLGPKSVSQEPSIQELPMGPTPVQAGLRTAGKGTAISWVTGLTCFGIGAAVANNSSDPWAGFTWIVVGAVVAVYGTIWSVIYGAFKGVQTSVRNNNERYRRELLMSNEGGGSTFIVIPVELEEIPENLRAPLLVGQR